MRLLVLLVLVAAPSAAPRAQAVDDALVDSVVASLRRDQVAPSVWAGVQASAQAVGTSGGALSAALTEAMDGLEGRIATRVRTEIAGLLTDLMMLDRDPTAFPLADSALAVRFLRANGGLQPPSEFDRQILRFVEETVRTANAANAARLVQMTRLVQGRFTPEEQAEMQEALAFSESEAGQYLQRVTVAPVQAETAAFLSEALQSILP